MDPSSSSEFGLGYAFGHGFSRVDFKGTTYRMVSRDLVFKSPQQQPLPAYRVVLDQRSPRRYPEFLRQFVSKGTMSLVDRGSGKNLAAFSLPADRWPGDQAGAWLAKLLRPNDSGRRLQEFDVSKSAQVELLSPSSVRQPNESSGAMPKTVGCPADLVYLDRPSPYGPIELRTPEWTLLKPVGEWEIHCTPRGVILAGSYWQEDLQLVVIDQAGAVIARGVVRNDKVHFGFTRYFTETVAFDDSGDGIVLRKAYFLPQSQKAEYEVNFNVPWSAIRLPR